MKIHNKNDIRIKKTEIVNNITLIAVCLVQKLNLNLKKKKSDVRMDLNHIIRKIWAKDSREQNQVWLEQEQHMEISNEIRRAARESSQSH